jgi:uncharacterized protein YwlG (UPF0340 family)
LQAHEQEKARLREARGQERDKRKQAVRESETLSTELHAAWLQAEKAEAASAMLVREAQAHRERGVEQKLQHQQLEAALVTERQTVEQQGLKLTTLMASLKASGGIMERLEQAARDRSVTL